MYVDLRRVIARELVSTPRVLTLHYIQDIFVTLNPGPRSGRKAWRILPSKAWSLCLCADVHVVTHSFSLITNLEAKMVDTGTLYQVQEDGSRFNNLSEYLSFWKGHRVLRGSWVGSFFTQIVVVAY